MNVFLENIAKQRLEDKREEEEKIKLMEKECQSVKVKIFKFFTLISNVFGICQKISI